MADASRSVTVRLKAEIDDFQRQMSAAATSARAVGTATEGTSRQMATAEGATRRTGAAAQAAASQLDGAAEAVAGAGGAAGDAAGQLDGATEAVAATGDAADTAATQLDGAAEAATATGTAAAAAGEQSVSGMDQLLATAHANEDAWDKVGKGLLAFGAAVMVGVGLSIAKFAEFDKAMSSVQAATHETAGNMDLLREAAIEAGADTAFSAKEAAQAIEELAKAGVTTEDILGGGLTGAMALAAAGGLAVGDAAEIAATAMTQFKLKGSEIPHVADLLAAGAGKAQGSVEDMGMALKQAGLVASQVGLTIDETAGGLAAFASAGMVGSDAGTSFKSMLQRLTPQSKEAQRAMDDLGISAYDSQGQFVGLEKFAGNLRKSMEDLTPQARNAAMGVIFGSDAVRAASVIYEQGAEGVHTWIDAVNDIGYAAETARLMQDNLAGDIEKLGGSMDTVFIKGGTGAAGVLRGLTQNLEGLVDAVGKIPTPILAAGVAAAALIGGVALLGGAFVSLVPKIAATKLAMATFSAASPRLAAGMIGIGKAAGIAAIAIIAVGAASSALSTAKPADVEKITQALIGLSKEGATVKQTFNGDLFAAANDTWDASGKINDLGSALKKVTDISGGDSMSRGVANLVNGFGAKTTTQLMETTKVIEGMDTALASLVTSGHADTAAASFQKIITAGEGAGVAAATTAGQFSQYTTSLSKQASQLGATLTAEELYQWALGNTPQKITDVMATQEGQTKASQMQAQASEESAKALDEVGLSAQGVIVSLGKLLDAMFATGLATLSAADAESKYQETLAGLDVAVQKVMASQSAGNAVLDAATGSIDLTSAAGRAANGVFGELAQAAISTTTAMAKNGASQPDLQGKLASTYESLKNTALGFGMGEAKADDMARSALGIPKGVDVATAIQNYADSMAKLQGVGAAADALNGKTANVWVTTHQNSIYSEEHVASGPGGSGGQTKAEGGLIQHLATGGGVKRFPYGGGITGPGTGTSDDVPIWASNGEFMQPTKAVQKYGQPFMESIRNLTYEAPSKSLAGGYGGGASQSYGYAAGASMASTAAEIHNHYHIDAKPGLASEYAKDIARQAVTRARDLNAVYGVNRTS